MDVVPSTYCNSALRERDPMKKIAFPLARGSFGWVDCSAAKQRVTRALGTGRRPC